MPKRIVVVASVKPFEVMTLVASALLGALYLYTFLIDPLGPRTIHALLPEVLVPFWYFLLLVGGVVGLVGICLSNVFTALLVERIGLHAVGFAISVYVLALFASSGLHALGAGILLMSLASACAWRIFTINRDLKRVHQKLNM